VLWSVGPATVREVYNVISRRRPAQYSTVLKFMQIMAEKGLVRRDETQRAHIYQPARPRE
jgi:predicted transcriptional regulator